MYHFPILHLFMVFQLRHFNMVLEIPWVSGTSSFLLLTYVTSIPNEKTEFLSPLHLSGWSLRGLVIQFSSVTWLSVGHKRNQLVLWSVLYCPSLLLSQDHFQLGSDVCSAGFYFKEKPIFKEHHSPKKIKHNT